jgi:hypothetical protein
VIQLSRFSFRAARAGILLKSHVERTPWMRRNSTGDALSYTTLMPRSFQFVFLMPRRHSATTIDLVQILDPMEL